MSELLLALLVFSATTCFTPGPNNLMLTASGATFGFRRTVPHLLGVALGFPVMIVLLGLGAGAALASSPTLHAVLRYVGAAYLCYLAWLVATASPAKAGQAQGGGQGDGEGEAGRSGRPLGFWRAAAFQWVNPKGWIMAVGSLSTFTTVNGDVVPEVLAIAGTFLFVGSLSAAAWAAFGTYIGRWLATPGRLRAFNVAMGVLLVLSIVPAFA